MLQSSGCWARCLNLDDINESGIQCRDVVSAEMEKTKQVGFKMIETLDEQVRQAAQSVVSQMPDRLSETSQNLLAEFQTHRGSSEA